MALTPLDITAQVSGLDAGDPERLTHGPRPGRPSRPPTGTIEAISLLPDDLRPCPEAAAGRPDADLVVLGPGSWFTSVLPHLMVPTLREALIETEATSWSCSTCDRTARPRASRAADHLAVLLDHAPDLPIGTVLVDAHVTVDPAELEELAASAARSSWSPTSPGRRDAAARPGEAATAYAAIHRAGPRRSQRRTAALGGRPARRSLTYVAGSAPWR